MGGGAKPPLPQGEAARSAGHKALSQGEREGHRPDSGATPPGGRTLECVWRGVRAVAVAVAMVLLSARPAALAQSDDEVSSAAGEAAVQPWSGWWWPAGSAGGGPTLFAPDGPLDKYDRYVAATSGESPGTRAWEREELYIPGVPWAGHCNGFAAAALLEPEPTQPISVLGITFSVADQKGLLVDYHFGDSAAWSFGADSDLNPADFHRMLLTWIGEAGQGFVLTYDMGGGEVWSYPAYKFESHWTADPGRIWYPEPTIRNSDRDLVSPWLDRQTIANILAGSDGSDITPTATPAAIVSPTAMSTPTPGSASTPVATSTPTPAATMTPTPTPTPSRAATPRVTPTRVPRRP